MDSCLGVEQDLDKAIAKFKGLNEHAERMLSDAVKQIQELKKQISEIPSGTPLTPSQTVFVRETVQRWREAIQHLASEHRDIHASVSRVGKSVDRHFVCEYGAVAPRVEQFCSDENRKLMEQAIAQHLYRQGMESAGDSLVEEARLGLIERGEPFAALQRTAAALAAGDAEPALHWAARHADRLVHSPLPFTLHRMHFLKLAREEGVATAVQYARENFPAHAARHERELQACVCALAWCTPMAQTHLPPTPAYAHLLDSKALGAAAAELFVKEACALLRLAPLSPLAAAVLAGGRVLPALLDIRSKMTHPHVIAAWAAKDELPLEVDLGEDGGGYHSVFACPILRQQASEQNPPMRLLCGHVISRDALNKLAQGMKLKCPYCPMEQSPNEARQIYFS